MLAMLALLSVLAHLDRSTRLLDAPQQLARPDAERPRKANDRGEARLTRRAFEATDLGWVKVAQVT